MPPPSGAKNELNVVTGSKWVARLIKNPERGVHRLHVMIRAHIAIRIGRITKRRTGSRAKLIPSNVSSGAWHAGHRTKDFLEQRLKLGETRALRSCWPSRVWITREPFLRNLWGWWDVRQVAQLSVRDNRADQTHQVRRSRRVCCRRRRSRHRFCPGFRRG